MKANTRLFGEIDIADDKIISLEDGMIGLPEYRNFALIFDEEKEKDKSSVMWFQSMDDPQTAFPVMQPNHVCPDYNPMVSDEMLRPLGGMTEDNTYVLVTLTAAPDPKDTSRRRLSLTQTPVGEHRSLWKMTILSNIRSMM